MFRNMTGQHAFCLLLSLLLAAGGAAYALAQPPQATTQASTQPATQPIDPWQADLDALEQPITLPAPRGSDSRSFTRHLGSDIPRSLITLNAIQLPAHRGNTFSDAFEGTAAEYAAHLMSLRIDQLFEQARDSEAIDLAQRLAGGRMRFGASRWIPAPPRLSILPGWLLPVPHIDLNPDVARDLQLTAQRLDDAGNFAGFVITGADRWTAAYLSDRLQEVTPSWIVTPGDFGGVSLNDSGEGLFSHLAVQQVLGLGDPTVSPPLYGVSLIDRLRSYHPHKQTWAIIDNAGGRLSRHELHRAYALALTRGIDAIGINWLPLPGDAQSGQAIAHLREIHEWAHRLGGVYGMTEPIPTIGVLYVHQQVQRGPSHAGMTSEAMILSHAAGYPSRVITPEELQRGLPDAMKAVLLVGLDRTEEQWAWHHGLEEGLRKYADQGGRFVIDEQSVAPVPAIKPGLVVADWFDTPPANDINAVLQRNQRNIAHLREALADVARPIGYSDDPTLWAIPSLAGNVEYVTVVSMRPSSSDAATSTDAPSETPAEQESADEPPAGDSPALGQIEWTSSRPVYDVRTRRKLSAEEARSVDLSAEGFHLYALPPTEPPPPSIHVEVDDAGCFIARVTSGDVRGLPIEVTISREMASEKIYRATGEPFRLPLQIYDEPGEYDIAVSELVTGQSASTRIVVPANAPPRRQNAASDRLARFAGRNDQPLVIALTPAQQADPQVAALAERLAAHFRSINRQTRIATAAPDPENGIVLASNPPADAARPRWRTQAVDLILLGTPRDNVLIRDQVLGRLLPPRVETPETHITWSAFAPNHQVLNLLGDGAAALTVLVEQIERDAR